MRGAKAGWRSPIRWGLAAACAALLTVATAQADGGEAGLVVQTDGKADTYCVALPDGGLNGEQLLSAAGYRVESVKSSSGNAVCALNEVGCFGATDFNSCYCKSFPPDSTYWAFFIMKGGVWQYASIAANRAVAHDGDVHGWKWGKGGPQSAPAPLPITFEQICGHPAGQGGNQAAPVTATPTVMAPTAPATTGAPPTAPGATPATPSAPAASSPPSVPGTVPAGITAITLFPLSPTATESAFGVSVTAHGTARATPVVPATGASSDSGGSGSLMAFGVVAVVLVAGIGGAAWWRRRHGS